MLRCSNLRCHLGDVEVNLKRLRESRPLDAGIWLRSPANRRLRVVTPDTTAGKRRAILYHKEIANSIIRLSKYYWKRSRRLYQRREGLSTAMNADEIHTLYQSGISTA